MIIAPKCHHGQPLPGSVAPAGSACGVLGERGWSQLHLGAVVAAAPMLVDGISKHQWCQGLLNTTTKPLLPNHVRSWLRDLMNLGPGGTPINMKQQKGVLSVARKNEQAHLRRERGQSSG